MRILRHAPDRLPGLVETVPPFGDKPLEAIRTHSLEQIAEASPELGRRAYRLAQRRKHLRLQEAPPDFERLTREVAAAEYQYIEDVIEERYGGAAPILEGIE